jgi:4-hydroxy-2-oxoheptanedioate aldolase
MIYRNHAREAIQKSGFALGTFIQIASPENAEIAAAVGFDFLIIDMEHGSFGIDNLVNMVRGVQIGGATPVVRVPDHSETGIFKTLDAGAVGLIIPGVSTAEQAKRVAKAARYAPLGTRGACPRVRATVHGMAPWEKHVEWSNENIMVWIIIETVEGFNNLEEIVKTPGIDAVAFGAFDLSQDMGLNGKTDHPDVKRRIEEGINIALKNNMAINMHLFEASPNEIRESARRWAKLGAKIMTCMTDRRILSTGLKETFSSLASVRSGVK